LPSLQRIIFSPYIDGAIEKAAAALGAATAYSLAHCDHQKVEARVPCDG
jgi:hypothetical protein